MNKEEQALNKEFLCVLLRSASVNTALQEH